MNKMTEEDLLAAFAGESQAHVKYLAFAEKARQEGYPKLAKLFEAVSFAELVHANNHLRVLTGLGNSSQNLQAAFDGESFEVDQMYPAYNSVAVMQEEQAAKQSIFYALEAEKVHMGLYEIAKRDIANGQDVPWQVAYICPICGYTVMDIAPDVCPVCKTPKDRFKKFE